MTDQTEPEDTCRPVEIDGELIRVRGGSEMSDESRAALADVIAVAKRKYAAEHPPVEVTDPERRERYAETLYGTLEVSPRRHPWATLSPLRRAVWYDRADAAIKLADAESAAVSSAGCVPAADQTAKAEALLLHFTAEAHRRKWAYDRGVDDDGVPIKSEAFDALHRLGEEMRVKLEGLRAMPAAVLPAPADRAAVACVRALHQQYAFGGDPQDYCAHCNQISGGWVPWPCPTVRALDGALAGRVAGDTQPETPACAECGHPSTAHSDGDDPVSPGRCADCPVDGEWHDYEAADAAVGGAQQQHAPGKAVLCRDCRDKGHTICMTDETQQDGASSRG